MVYVDTSVIVALLTVEPSTEAATAWFSGFDGTLISSDWLLTEFSNAIAIKIRTGQMTKTDAKAVTREIQLLSSSGLRMVQVNRLAFQQASEMVKAYQYGLRCGDSLHLAIARELGIQIVATLDKNMAKNAERFSMSTIQFDS